MNFQGLTPRTAQQDGRLFGSNLPGMQQKNEKVTTYREALDAAFALLGAPPNTNPNIQDDLPADFETVAKLYIGARPTPLENIIISGSVENYSVGHFKLLYPVNAQGNLNGFEVSVLSFSNTFPDHLPEATSPRMIQHKFQKRHMRHERFGIGFQMSNDCYMMPDGKQLYAESVFMLVQNIIILAQVTITSALLTANDPYFKWRRVYTTPGTYSSSASRMSMLDDQFAVLHKSEKAWPKLMDQVSWLSSKSNVGAFTHVLVTSKVPRQLAYGDDFETEYYRRGPEAPEILTQGSNYFMRKSDIEFVIEPDYNLDNVGQTGDDTTKMMTTRCQVGRWFYIGRDAALVRDELADPKIYYGLHYLDFDQGNVEMRVQRYPELLSAALCWGKDGNLDPVYYDLCSGNNAHQFARNCLQIESLYPNDDTRDRPLIDPFIATNAHGVAEPTVYLGNQSTQYTSYDTQEAVARAAKNRVDKRMLDGDQQKIQKLLEMLDRNYRVGPDFQGRVEGWFYAVLGANRVRLATNQNAEIIKDRFGSPKLPYLVRVGDAYYISTSPTERGIVHRTAMRMDEAGNVVQANPNPGNPVEVAFARAFPGYQTSPGGALVPEDAIRINEHAAGPFPGFTTISNARMLADAYATGETRGWSAVPEYAEMFKVAAEGMLALDRYADAYRQIFSTPECRNAFFDDRNLPLFQKTGDKEIDSLTTFQQDLVQGIRYPIGIASFISPSLFRQAGNLPNATPNNVDPLLRLFSSTTNQGSATLESAEPMQSDATAAAFARDMFLDEPNNPNWNNRVAQAVKAMWSSGLLGSDLAAKLRTPGGRDEWKQKYSRNPASDPKNTGIQGDRARSWEVMMQSVRKEFQDQFAEQRDVSIKQMGDTFALFFSGVQKIFDAYDDPNNKEKIPLLDKEGLHYIVKLSIRGRPQKRFLSTGEDVSGEREEMHARTQAATAAAGGGSPARVVNLFLSVHPEYWKKVGNMVSEITGSGNTTIGATLSVLRPVDPEAPDRWLGLTPDYVRTLAAFGPGATADAVRTSSFSEEILKFARAKYDLQGTSQGEKMRPLLAGARFADQPAGIKRKRFYDEEDDFDDFARPARFASGKYITLPPRQPGFEHDPMVEEWFADDLRSHVSSDTGVAEGTRDAGTTFHAQRKAPHHMPFGQLPMQSVDVMQQAPNQYWEFRWNWFVRRYGADYQRLVPHLLYCGTRVNRDVFLNMVEEGVLPPITLIPVDPFIEFETVCAVFVKSSRDTGRLSYDLSQFTLSYDGSHKVLYGNLTMFMGALVTLIQNVLVMPHIMFNQYLGGGNGALVRSIKNDEYDSGDIEHYDYNPYNPMEGPGKRFVLYAGGSRKVQDIPDPLPLTGSLLSGSFMGLGAYITKGDLARAVTGPAYDSAIVVNKKTGFYKLNNGSPRIDEEASYSTRSEISESMYNLVCCQGNQFAMDLSTGSIKRRFLNGTGPLGKLCEGVGSIFNGAPGTISKQMELSRQG